MTIYYNLHHEATEILLPPLFAAVTRRSAH